MRNHCKYPFQIFDRSSIIETEVILMKYRIVSDSSINLFHLDADVDYTTVPLKIRIDDIEYVDAEGIDVVDLVARMHTSENPSTTSCPSVMEWLEAFRGADCVFGITISSGLSGSYNSAMQAKEMYLEENPGAKVHIVDSRATGGTLRLIAERLAECIQKEMTFETIRLFIDDYQKHDKIVFMLESLDNLAKNGRCPMAFAKIAGILGIRFIGRATEEGTIQQAHICRGTKKMLRVSLEEMESLGYQGGRVRISHCLSPENAYKFRDTILAKYPKADVVIDMTTGLCSYYAEEGGLIVGFEDLPPDNN